MKTLWNILSIVAVANMLALAGVVGWLRMNDRLNADRGRVIRELLSKTLTEEAAEAEAAKLAEEKARAEEEAQEKAARAPLTAAQKLAARGESTELDAQRAERVRREITDLRSQLARDLAEIERQRADLQRREQEFTSLVEAGRRQLEDEQFQKTLGVLSALKPAQAVSMLRTMLDPPPTAPGAPPEPVSPAAMGTVVSYLDAMDDRTRSRVLGEWAKGDPSLATQLLERLRTRAAFAPVQTP
ncbi:MAG: hypothetical protein SFY69_00735 [Planctomycetota bacterium]|nr:hypothetical protein [Planctomycetota bacterium]